MQPGAQISEWITHATHTHTHRDRYRGAGSRTPSQATMNIVLYQGHSIRLPPQGSLLFLSVAFLTHDAESWKTHPQSSWACVNQLFMLRCRHYAVIERSKFCVEETRRSAIHPDATRGLWPCPCVISGGLLSDSLVFWELVTTIAEGWRQFSLP